jgi:hypothetical protein
MMKTKAFCVLLTARMAVVSTCVVSAQSSVTLPTVGLLEEFTKKTLVGSWVETVHFDNGRPDLKSLVSFHADGTSFASDQGTVVLPPDPHARVSSSGVGAWTQLEWHTFAYTNEELFSDFSGNLKGFFKVSGKYTLTGSGDTYKGTSTFEVFDTSSPQSC